MAVPPKSPLRAEMRSSWQTLGQHEQDVLAKRTVSAGEGGAVHLLKMYAGDPL